MGELKDIIGQTFGKLTVQVRAPNDGTNAAWACLCECGKSTVVKGTSLRNGNTTSCGCNRVWHLKGSDNIRWAGFGQISGAMWSHIQCHAKSRNIPVMVTIQEAWSQFEKQKGQCAITGLPLAFGRRRIGKTASLDRIDSEGDYSIDNIQWIHKIIQGMKMAMPQAEFIKWCKVVAHHQALDA